MDARLGAQAVPAYTGTDLVPGGGSLDEARVVQPVIMLHARAWRRLELRGTANLEGLTMPGGELTPGVWGEGFVDRRHPHTYLHELMLTLRDPLGRLGGDVVTSVSVGKGFAPFGTDDPMVRPPLRYPVNHHLAQILERALAEAVVEVGPVTAAAALFNGDEPERPGQWPNLGRFGDSWSARLTLRPVAELELQGSHAQVASPEHRLGAGPDQAKWSLSARWDGPVGRDRVYGLLEWARTSEADGFFGFRSVLAEGAWDRGDHRLLYRFERTERPEEARTEDPFRSARPHLDNSILGVTRWTVHTAGYTFRGLETGTLRAEPLVELSVGRVTPAPGDLVNPAAFYSGSSFWAVTVGVRLGGGAQVHRMGRYGADLPSTQPLSRTHSTNEGHHDSR